MQKLVMTAAGRDGLPACYCGALTETPSTASRKEQTTEENPLAINGRKKMNIFRGCARKKKNIFRENHSGNHRTPSTLAETSTRVRNH